MTTYIAGDKHGFKVIEIVKEWLLENEYKFKNLGISNREENISLQEMLPKVAKSVLQDNKNQSFGIVSCGTGIGVEFGINKFSGIRAVLATDPQIAEWARVKDNCNVLCLVGWRPNKDNISSILDKWFSAGYDGSEKRLEMMNEFNKWH